MSLSKDLGFLLAITVYGMRILKTGCCAKKSFKLFEKIWDEVENIEIQPKNQHKNFCCPEKRLDTEK